MSFLESYSWRKPLFEPGRNGRINGRCISVAVTVAAALYASRITYGVDISGLRVKRSADARQIAASSPRRLAITLHYCPDLRNSNHIFAKYFTGNNTVFCVQTTLTGMFGVGVAPGEKGWGSEGMGL
jgi:hypothetical protein